MRLPSMGAWPGRRPVVRAARAARAALMHTHPSPFAPGGGGEASLHAPQHGGQYAEAEGYGERLLTCM